MATGKRVRYMRVKDVAEYLDVSKMTVYRLMKSGELSGVRIGRSFRISEEELNAYELRAAIKG